MPHVTMIHGIGNKPPPDLLLASWKNALADDSEHAGIDLDASGVTTSMVYWADVLYDDPGTPDQAHESVGSDDLTSEGDEELLWLADLSASEEEFVNKFRERINFDAPPPEGDDAHEALSELEDGSFERIPLPWFIKRRLMKAFLRDVHHYLFNATSRPRNEEYKVQDEIRRRFCEALKRDAAANRNGPHIVLSHSMGTVIAYDCLKRVSDCQPVDALMTIGCPLGIDEVQDLLEPEYTREDGYPSLKVSEGWANVFDSLDVVAALDKKIANDFQQAGQKVINDITVENRGKWRHGISQYLRRKELRDKLGEQLGL